MQPDRKLYAQYVVAGLAHFSIVALSAAVAAYVIGVVFSVFAYVLWSAGWGLGLWVLEVMS